MSFPDIHACIKLTAENEELKRKYVRIKRQRDDLLQQLNKIKEKEEKENLLRNYVTTRESSTQTDNVRQWQPLFAKKPPETLAHKAEESTSEKLNKLLSMHSQAMRRYEKEVKVNMIHMDTITDLNIRISDLEKALHEVTERCRNFERELINARSHKPKSCQSKAKEDPPGHDNINSSKYKHLLKENRKLKEELKGLDFGFFEEIEDIKFALKKSSELNIQYEKTLKKLCHQFGLPFPKIGHS